MEMAESHAQLQEGSLMTGMLVRQAPSNRLQAARMMVEEMRMGL